MTAEHDATTGRLRCSDDELDAMLADPGCAPPTVRQDPRASAAIEAIRSAQVVGRLVVSGARGVLDHRFWIAHAAAAFLLARGEPGRDASRGDLVGCAPDQVPGHLARLAALGPRRVPAVHRPRALEDDTLISDLTHLSDLRRGSALEVLGAQRCWRLDVKQGSDAGGVDHSSVIVLDGGGFWVLDPAATRLEPTTPTALWCTLVSVLE